MTLRHLPMLALFVLGLGCRAQAQAQGAPPYQVDGNAVALPPSSPQLAALAVETVEQHRGASVHLTGRLAWNEDVTVRVFSPFAGRVTKVLVGLGDTVKKGAPLARIESPDYAQAQSDAAKAESDYALSGATLARARDLFEHGAAAKKDLTAAEADQARTRSEKERATSRLASYGGKAPIVNGAFVLPSPIGGVVTEKTINPGQEIRPDQMLSNAPPLFVVTDPTKLWLWLDASERDLPRLKTGMPLVLHPQSSPESRLPGVLDIVTDTLDPTTRTVKLRGSVVNPDRKLKAEMYVAADALDDDALSIDVSKGAVLLEKNKHYVFVETRPGRFERREIPVGVEHDGRMTVLGGLSSGEQVVTEGCLLLEDWLESGQAS
jgi:membrane fusion protein, heavy metal efflux system